VAMQLQGAMAATYQAGYRMAMIMASAGARWLAAAFDPTPGSYAYNSWQTAYYFMAACMSVGMVTSLIIREPEVSSNLELNAENERLGREIVLRWHINARFSDMLIWLYGAVVAPFRDFITRFGLHALLILSLIAVYRISDVVMGVMSNPFYVDMGYSKDEVATVSKVYGVIMTILGAVVGGVLTAKTGIIRTLFLGAVLSAATNLLFVWLASRGHDISGLVFVISADNLSAGIASSAFVAYLS